MKQRDQQETIFCSMLFFLMSCGIMLISSSCAHPTDSSAPASSSAPTRTTTATSQGAHPEQVGVTIFLRHQQSKSLDELLESLKSSKFYRSFPPDGVEVVRWDVVMGIGQIVTVLARPADIRAVNTVIEKRAWGSFDTEFYPTYVPRDPGISTAPRTDTITNKNYVLFTVIAEHGDGTRSSTRKQPDRSTLPDDVRVETIRRLMGYGTLYTFRVPPDRVSSLHHTLERWVPDADDLEVYTSYNFLPIHQKITSTGSAE